MNPMNLTRHATTNGAARDGESAGGGGAGGAVGRPLAHAIALRLLTAKGADAVGLKGYVARAGLADVMVDVLEELTRRVRGLRVEFEDVATRSRPATPGAAPANTGAAEAEAAPPPAPAPGGRPANPGW